MYKIIDISKHQRGADLSRAINDGVDGFIFHAAYGDDISSQDDTAFEEFVAQAEALGKPWGAYIFSYAVNDDLGFINHPNSEIEHLLRVLNGRKPSLGVWLDIENDSGKEKYGWRDEDHADELNDYIDRFCNRMEEEGLVAGVYCDLSHTGYLSAVNNHKLWVARYADNPDSNNPPRDCDIWQYTSTESIDGVSDSVDCNWVYADWIKSILEGSAGNDNESNESDNADRENINGEVNVSYQARVGGRWLPVVENDSDYAGIVGESISDIAIGVDKGSIKYRVHVLGGDWLPYVDGFDIEDAVNGYAGNGLPLDAIEVYYYTPKNIAEKSGYKKAVYKVSPINCDYYSEQHDNDTDNGQDGYAGMFGKAIDRFQIVIA